MTDFKTQGDVAQPAPSPSPVSAPSPAGGVREAVARIIDPHSFVPYEPTGAAEDAVFADMVKSSLEDAYRKADRILALSSPATPEPVSAPANGEVVDVAWREIKWDHWARDGAKVKLVRSSRGGAWRVTFDDGGISNQSTLEQAKSYADDRLARLAAALSNPAPGHTDLMVSPESIDAFLEKNAPGHGEAES